VSLPELTVANCRRARGARIPPATLVFPFVVIRVFAAERASGAWTLLVQAPSSVARMISAKSVVLLGAWGIALMPSLVLFGVWPVIVLTVFWRVRRM
jgi:hypothetical protein